MINSIIRPEPDLLSILKIIKSLLKRFSKAYWIERTLSIIHLMTSIFETLYFVKLGSNFCLPNTICIYRMQKCPLWHMKSCAKTFN